MNVTDPDAAHPFLDLMNIGAIIFDGRQGTTYMPITTAMGEAYLYGEAVVMDDETAIKTLQTKAAVRKIVEKKEPVALDSADSVAVNAAETSVENPGSENPDAFYYKEIVILSEKPNNDYKGSVREMGPVQGLAKIVENPKMDTQVFDVVSDRPGFMVVAGNYHPYWKASVNGTPAKVLKAFGNLRAVEIPAGKSVVRMEYRSVPLHKSFWVSAAALFVLLALVGFVVVKKK